jgi:hypothetical protein
MTDFAREHAHSDDIDTSHIAAGRAEGLAAQHKAMVYAALVGRGPLSSQQIAAATGLEYLQVVRRVSDLRNENVVIDSGDRLPTKAGRKAAVWKLAPVQLDLLGAAQ